MPARADRIGALVFFSGEFERTIRFYLALGLQLERERHDDGPDHYACELGGAHVAVYRASGGGAPPHRSAGSTFPGLVVDSVAESLAAVRDLDAVVLQEPEMYPWGLRAVVQDPDGRAVEIFEPQHAASAGGR